MPPLLAITQRDGVREGKPMKTPSKRSSTSRVGSSAIPRGLESDPIALQLQKMGHPVTRAGWLMLDRGSSGEEDLDPETLAFLDHYFPQDS